MVVAARSSRKLSIYRSKRDFHRTAEPSGKVAKKAGHSYLIQKHAARRLHYDFRIELNGVLLSWAVTKGPSLDPEVRRLAVHVEDHPLQYGKFEGTIPKGEYGGGTVMLWDRGSWEPIGDAERDYARGRLDFELHGERLKGRWHLVRMRHRNPKDRGDNWLLIKGHDEYARPGKGDSAIEDNITSVTTDRKMEEIAKGRKVWHSNRSEKTEPKRKKKSPRSMPAPGAVKPKLKRGHIKAPPAFIEPQLATLATRPPHGERWVHEIKFDGYRLLARLEDGEVTMTSRNENDWTDKFGAIATSVAKLKARNALLDGEIVHQGADGSMTFHGLQQALSQGDESRMHYFVFDILFLDGEDVRSRPLLERKALLQNLLIRAPANIHFSEHYERSGEEVLSHACNLSLEGIISKRADRPYVSGRTMEWIKAKCIKEQELVIGGYTTQPKHPGILGAIITGYYQDGELRYAGKVGTGFTNEDAAKVMKKLLALKASANPFKDVSSLGRRSANWVKPKLVAEVNFSEWTPDGHMRHPSFQGLREDKAAKDVTREAEKKPPDTGKKKMHSMPKRGSRTSKHDAELAGVRLSHPDKIIYPESGVTKRMLADYYLKVADRMLPHIASRPISLLRLPGGLGHQQFFQRHVGQFESPHIESVRVDMKHDHEPYMMIHDVAGLIQLVQIDALEIHVWGAEGKTALKPDRIVFDFDPAPDVPFARVKQAAIDMRGLLKHIKLTSFLKTTGGKGLHVVVPFQKGPGWDEVKDFTKQIGEAFVENDPEHFTVNMRKDIRGGKIYIDYLRNGLSASAIAPYSTRAREGVPVALPTRWEDLKKLKSAQAYRLQDIQKHLKANPWKTMARTRQKLPL